MYSNKVQILIIIFLVAMNAVYAGNDKKDKEVKVNTSNPEAVAKAFINSLKSKTPQEAMKYVIQKDQDSFKNALKKGIPPLPKNPKIKVVVKKNGIQADVQVINSIRQGPPFGFDMELKNGKWWIVK